MRDVIYLLFNLLTTLARLLRPGGGSAVIAESLLLKRQLIIHSRSRQRAPNLTTRDRALLGFMSLFLSPRRIIRAAIIIKPSTLLSFHSALKKRKYCLLYSPRGGRKPGPKGPSREVIKAIVEMKQRNPRYGCPRIAQQINLAFGLELDKDIVRRVLAIHYKPDSTNSGPSWLTTLGHAKDSLWSVDLFRAESITLKTHWIMVVMDQYARRSHPFVERLIGSVRRELLDQTFFWTATDLDNKLRDYQCYYNKHRCHTSRDGATPAPPNSNNVISLNDYRWMKHCRGLFQLPFAA